MAITPKMLGSGISSGTLQVVCNEGAPPFGISNSQGYTVGNIMKKAWLDSSKTHLYVYTNYPESVSIYDISYDSKDRLIMTYDRTIHIPPFKGTSSGNSYTNVPIGFVCRDNIMYYFYSWNYSYGPSSGSSSNATFYAVKIEIGESDAVVTTNSHNVYIINSTSDMSSRVVTTENSDNILILCNITGKGTYYRACKLSTLMTDELIFSSIYSNIELVDKDSYTYISALTNGANRFLIYDFSSGSAVSSYFSSDSYYKMSNSLTSDCCGIITQYDDYYIFECYVGAPYVSNLSYLYTANSANGIQYALIPYIRNLALSYPINSGTNNGYVDNNRSFISHTSSFGNVSRVFDHTCASVNICGSNEAAILTQTPSVSKYSTVELYYRVSCQNKYFNAINYAFATAYPKGFYANMIAIAHNNKLYGLSICRSATNGFAPVGSYLLSVLDYDPDNDEFSQSYSHFKPLVAKSENIQEVVSIIICKTKVKDLIEFDSYGFDYGNDCRIVLRNSTTGEAINIYEGEIKDVFDFSSHPIIINPGYELYVLTTYETWQCTAFGIKIT